MAVLQKRPEEGSRIVITRDVDLPLWRMPDEVEKTLQAPRMDRIGSTPSAFPAFAAKGR